MTLMSNPETALTPAVLQDWPLPEAQGSKHDRGRVLVLGGARGTPGAVILAGLASLRVGAGHLSLAVAESVAAQVAVAVPESGVVGLLETDDGSIAGRGIEEVATDIAQVDVVLIGPGLDEPEQTKQVLTALFETLGPTVESSLMRSRWVCCPRWPFHRSSTQRGSC